MDVGEEGRENEEAYRNAVRVILGRDRTWFVVCGLWLWPWPQQWIVGTSVSWGVLCRVVEHSLVSIWIDERGKIRAWVNGGLKKRRMDFPQSGGKRKGRQD